jgi:hypothetical protein
MLYDQKLLNYPLVYFREYFHGKNISFNHKVLLKVTQRRYRNSNTIKTNK